MRLTLYQTLWIHTLLLVGIGGYVVVHRRVTAKTTAVKQVRMPTLAELLEIERLGRTTEKEIFTVQGAGDEASRKRRLALLDLQLRYMPPEHPEVVHNRRALAQLFERSERYPEAAEQYRALLKVYQRLMGATEPETLSCEKDLKGAMWHVTQAEEAERRQREEYKRQSLALGKEDGRVLMIQAEIADQLMAQSKYPEAENELRTVVSAQLRKEKDTYGIITQNMFKLIMCLEAQGKRKAALEVVEEMEWLQADTPGERFWLADRAPSLREEINEGRIKRRGK